MTLDSQPEQQTLEPADAQIIRALVSAVATITIVGVGLSLTMTLIALRLGEQGFTA